MQHNRLQIVYNAFNSISKQVSITYQSSLKYLKKAKMRFQIRIFKAKHNVFVIGIKTNTILINSRVLIQYGCCWCCVAKRSRVWVVISSIDRERHRVTVTFGCNMIFYDNEFGDQIVVNIEFFLMLFRSVQISCLSWLRPKN